MNSMNLKDDTYQPMQLDSSALPVASRWSSKKVKYLATLENAKSTIYGRVVALENIESNTGKLLHTEADYSGESVSFIPNDVLFGKLRPYLRKVYISNFHGFAFGDILVFRPKAVVPKFLFYMFISDEFINCVEQATYGTKMPRANPEVIQNIRIPAPCLPEQQKIAQFLDFETAKINALIDEQKRLIELLKEKRQAVISHAITQGLKSNAPMKDSQVEWIGAIPSHWKLKSVKRLFKIKKRIPKKLGFDVLSITQAGIKIKDIESGDGQLASDYTKYQLVEPGDLAMNQMDLLTGYVDISAHQGVTSPDYRVFSLLAPNEHYPKFFLRVFQNAYHQKIFFPLGQGAAHLGRWRLPREAFNEFAVPVPPRNEQQQIDEFLTEELTKHSNLIDVATKQITLLDERRSALISAAVTGKIDVRDWQPPQGSDTVEKKESAQTEMQHG